MNVDELDPADPEGAIAAAVARVSNWGRWGPDDVRGTMNFLDSAKRVAAAALIRSGEAISLAQAFDMDGPQKGWRRRTNPIHTMLDTDTDTGTDAVADVQDRLPIGDEAGVGGARPGGSARSPHQESERLDVDGLACTDSPCPERDSGSDREDFLPDRPP